MDEFYINIVTGLEEDQIIPIIISH